MTRDVFISYRSEDRAAAERICAGLEQSSISCWLAPRDIAAGQEWATAIVEALQQCKTFVVVLSSNSKNAKQISREAELADKQGLPIITFRIEDVQPPSGLVYFLGNIQWLDAFGGQFDAALARLAQTIKAREKSGPEETTAALPPRPSVTIQPSPAAPWKAVGVGIAALVLILAGWLLLKPAKPARVQATPANGSAGARAVADRFLTERESGDFDAAWNEYTPQFRGSVNRASWQRAAEKRNAVGVRHQFNGCKEEGGGYACSYTLLYKDGKAEIDSLRLISNESGRWVISGGNIAPLR